MWHDVVRTVRIGVLAECIVMVVLYVGCGYGFPPQKSGEFRPGTCSGTSGTRARFIPKRVPSRRSMNSSVSRTPFRKVFKRILGRRTCVLSWNFWVEKIMIGKNIDYKNINEYPFFKTTTYNIVYPMYTYKITLV